MNKGINIFGNMTETAVMKELQKIHDMNTYKPMDASMLIYQDIKDALASLLFITEKRNGDIKAIKVAVGSRQRTYDVYDKRNVSSLTVNNENVFYTGVIDTYEHKDLAMLNIENSFLHDENDEYVLILLRGKLSELLVKMDPKFYQKYVITSKQGVPILYVKLTKVLYGILRRAMMF